MSLVHSSSIVTDGLLFYYDQNNTQKSWKGKPTTNLITNPLYVTGNTSTTNIQSSGYGGTATLVTAPSSDLEKISKYWIKYVKTAVDDGRIFFLGDVGTLNIGVDYTYSVYIYTNDSNVSSLAFGSDNTGVSYNSSNLVTWATTDRNQVKRISTIFRSLNGGHCQGFRIANNDPVGSTVYYTGIQCELGSFATPIVNGTRSNTQAILDLTGNNTITANSLTYASDGSFSFNGAGDLLECTNSNILNSIGGTSNVTVESWVNLSGYGSSGYGVITHKGTPWTWLMENPGNTMRIRFTLSTSGDVSCADSSTHALNTWYHFVGTYDGINMKFYRNGVLTNSVAGSGTLGVNTVLMKIGNYGLAYYSQGQIPIVRIYNKTLSANEIQQNFNATRGRYGL